MKRMACLLLGLGMLLNACQWMPKMPILGMGQERHFSANNTALKPEPRTDEWWVNRQAGVIEQVKRGDCQLIFIGDSITHGWDSVAPDLWTFYFGAWHPINMGFGGDRTQQVLWRLDHGSLDGISPKAAVIMIGTNNSNGRDNTAEEIAEGITMIVDRIHAKLPRTKVLLLGIFPRNDKPNPQREKNNQVNQIIAKLADQKTVFYMDIGQNFLNPDQTLPKDIMPDFLHPNRIGYRIWAISIKDQLKKMMQ
jgi:lysophospholipase L1-like esterase